MKKHYYYFLFLPLLPHFLFAQVRVSGSVTDESGTALIGVNILVEGTASGTVTDFDGDYSLTVLSEDARLVFSYLGYSSQTIDLNGRTTLDVVMDSDVTTLQDLVVIGYGSEKKADLTGSVASVSTEAIQQVSVSNALEGIKGRVTGVDITTTDSAPGASPDIKIRGHNTISGSNRPLIVIDGYTRAGDLRSINPRDIKSIEVLKDASSTAIYGARGANGVILVTTFEGGGEKPVIKLSTALRAKEIRRTLDVFDGPSFQELRREAGFNVSDEQIANASTTDWQDAVYRSGLEQNYQLSYSGGTEKTKYYVSGNYFDDKGIVENSFFKRYSIRGRITTELAPWAKISNTLYLSSSESNGTARNNIGFLFDPSLSTSALTFLPFLDVRDENGDYTSTQATTNPVAIAQERTDLQEDRFNYNYTTLDITPIKNLTLRSTFGITRRDRVDKEYWPSTVTNVTDEGVATVENRNNVEWSNENLAIYSNTFGGHNLSATAGFTQEFGRFESFSSQGVGFLTNDFGVFNLGGSQNREALQIASGVGEEALRSFLGRVSYNFKNRYYLTASFRRDGNSRFATNNKWGNFPGVAVAWRLSEEPFMAELTAVDNLKLRASYGITGNASALGFYESLVSFVPDGLAGATVFNNTSQTSLRIISLGNSDLGWERSAQYNIGLDVFLFNERVNLVADAYYKETTDLLLNVELPPGLGVRNRRENVGRIENRGLEISLQTTNIRRSGLTWRTTINYSFFRNEVLDLPDRPFFFAGPNAGLTDSQPMIIQEGRPLGSFFGYVHGGVFATNETGDRIDYSTVINRDNLEGFRRLVDINGDNRVTPDDRTIIGSAQPDFSFGFINDVNYGNFDLSVYVQGVIGQDVYNMTRYYTENTNLDFNVLTTVENRWTPENRDADIPGVNKFLNFANSYNIEDGSYIKFRDIQIGYSVPDALLERARLGYARVFASLQNFIVLTDYSGYDPEVNLGGGSSQLQNIDLGAYPTSRSVTFGLNLEF